MADLYRPYSEGLLSEEPTRLEDMYAPAATGLLFAPGAGVADLMGQAPDPRRPGEMLPSFYENVTGGNYLDAGLQALGGAGDAVQMMGAAFPPALAVGAAMKAPRGIRAFHGSPYHFDKFRLDKIGTGEGAQAYGRGLYFAGAEPTAMAYRDELRAMKNLQSDFDIRYKGDLIGNINEVEGPVGEVAREIKRSSVFPDKAIDNLVARKTKEIENIKTKKGGDPEADDLRQLLIDDLEASISEVKQINPNDVVFDKGAMYEVNIDASPDEMLDWQAPYKDQSEAVKKAIADAGYKPEDERTPGFLIHQRIVEDYSDMDSFDNPYANPEADAANVLLEAGIPGIKYLDAGSRTADASAPSRTSNYVIFDDSMIEIMRKYGLLAPLVGAGTVAAVSDMGEDRGLLEM
jgi:hypothetical protein